MGIIILWTAGKVFVIPSFRGIFCLGIFFTTLLFFPSFFHPSSLSLAAKSMESPSRSFVSGMAQA